MDNDEMINALVAGWKAKEKIDDHTSFEFYGVNFGSGKGPCDRCIRYAGKLLAGWSHEDALQFLCRDFQDWLADIDKARKVIEYWSGE